MRVLHYTLGLPPLRRGGLTSWSMRLMEHQKENGVEVSLLYPGPIRQLRKSMRIYDAGETSDSRIKLYELANPLPIPLIYGIDSTKHYFNYRSPSFNKFFKEINVDIIHIHTFMGLPVEFLIEAKQHNIKILYTTHDMFGVWPNTKDISINLSKEFDEGHISHQKQLPYLHIVIMQSKIYKLLKNGNLMSTIRLLSRKKLSNKNNSKGTRLDRTPADTYTILREKYLDYFKLVDIIHYNSPLVKEVFNNVGIVNTNVTIPIQPTISPLPQQLLTKSRNKRLEIIYSGTTEKYKGYDMLINVLDEIYLIKPNSFRLTVYGGNNTDRKYILNKPSYSHSDISNIYSKVDVTIVPTLTIETFGMVVPESLSNATPVIASETVGSKYLLENGKYGLVFSSSAELKQQIISMIDDPSILESLYSNIKSEYNVDTNDHKSLNEILQTYITATENRG